MMRFKRAIIIGSLILYSMISIIPAQASTYYFAETIPFDSGYTPEFNVWHGDTGYNQLNGYVIIGSGAGARLTYIKLHWGTQASIFCIGSYLTWVKVYVTLHVGANSQSLPPITVWDSTAWAPWDERGQLAQSINLWVSGSGAVYATVTTKIKYIYGWGHYLTATSNVYIYPF